MKLNNFFIIIFLGIIFTSCNGSYQYNEKKFEGNIEDKTKKVYYNLEENEETIKNFVCNNYLKSSFDNMMIDSNGYLQIELNYISHNNNVLLDPSLNINNNSCEFISFKNVDTNSDYNLENLTFLNGQTGLIKFKCGIDFIDEIKVGEFKIMAENVRTGLEFPTYCEIKNKKEKIKSYEINKDIFPNKIGDYIFKSISIEEEDETDLMIKIIYSNDLSDYNKNVELLLVILKPDFEDEIISDLKDEVYIEEINSKKILLNSRGGDRIYWFPKNIFDIILSENTYDINSKEVIDWFIEEFEPDGEKLISKGFLYEEEFYEKYENYQNQLNVKIEEKSNTGSSITVERIESSGSIYVKNVGSEDLVLNNIKVSPKDINDDFQCSSFNVLTNSNSVTRIDINCNGTLVVGKIANIVLVTDLGVFSAEQIIR